MTTEIGEKELNVKVLSMASGPRKYMRINVGMEKERGPPR